MLRVSYGFQESQADQAVGARDDRVLRRARLPSQQPARLGVRAVLALAQLRDELFQRGIAQRREAHEPVRQLPRRHFGARSAHACLEHLRDFEHRHEVAGRAQKALAARGGMSHGAHVQVRNVTDVDDAEPALRATRHRAVHHALNDHDRRRIVLAEHRTQDRDGIDHRQLRAAFLRDEVPRRAFRDRLRLDVGRRAVAVDVGPARLVEWRVLRLQTVADGSE